jgi:hypothetical protein
LGAKTSIATLNKSIPVLLGAILNFFRVKGIKNIDNYIRSA